MKDIAVVILNHIQYDNIASGLKELEKCGYTIDVYCSRWGDDPTGMNDMFDDIANHCKQNNFNVYRTINPDFEYKVLLEPYPSLEINARYKIKYRYSNVSAKPNVVYKPQNYLLYDAVLCSGDYDSNYLSAFTKTYKTANLKYENFQKSAIRKSDKKHLLYLPTYGEESSIEQIIDVLDELKKHYYLVAKVHHGTNYLVNEQNRINILKCKVDELYDSHMPLTKLLETTDVILTDNSGSVFEGIFTEIPVAVFCDNINKNKLGEFNTTQYELYKEGILPYTSNPSEILNVLENAQSEVVFNKQREWNRTYFYHPNNFTTDFVNVIKTYLNEGFDKRYYQMHRVLSNSYYNNIRESSEKSAKIEQLHNQITLLQTELATQKNINSDLEKTVFELNSQINHLNEQVDSLSRQVAYYNNGTLYKLAKKIYKLKNGD